MQDLFGKRYIAILGAILICVGIIVLGTAHTFGQGVTGMAFAGAGAGIGELTGLAGYASKSTSCFKLELTIHGFIGSRKLYVNLLSRLHTSQDSDLLLFAGPSETSRI